MADFACPFYLRSSKGKACQVDLSHLSYHVCQLLKNIYSCYDKEMSFQAVTISSWYIIFVRRI